MNFLYWLPQVPQMPPAARSHRPSVIHDELHFALQGVADSMTTQITERLTKRLKGYSAKELKAIMAPVVSVSLEAEFKRELLHPAPESRKRRALLTYVLTQVDARDALGKDVPGAREGRDLVQAGGEWLTSQEASKLLHVSRTHMNTLLDGGALGEILRTAGGHRRVSKEAVLAYKEQSQQRQAAALNAVAEASQRLGLYAGELEGIARKGRR